MFNVFLVCAVVGGSVFVLQFVLALVGMSDTDMDFADDVPDDIPDDFGEAQGETVGHGSTWLFGVISFRTIVAALTFFGLAGMASLQAGQGPLVAGVIAVVCGAAAMYGIHWLMRLLFRLGADGTVRIERSVGRCGSVYVPVPGARSGTGKIQLQVQDRIMEYQAVTSSPDKLATGAKVVVVNVVNPTTVEVELAEETVQT